jgi:amidase
MTELHELDGTAQAELVAAGEISPVDLVDHAVDRIERLNPRINAVIWTNFEQARKQAASDPSPGGPFGGVPFLLKDIGATQAGLPYWAGNRALKAIEHRLPSDTELGARFRDAGLITVGKTNLPELGSSPTTQPRSCGPTNNPWDLERSPAGSSGGAGAAVASGMVALAHANDGGGSTRLPASWCGLVGLKTTRGRIPMPDGTSRLISELAVTKSVRDTARLLDAVSGPTDADLYRAPEPTESFAAGLGRTTPPKRIALITDGGPWTVDPECVAAAEQAAKLLSEMGHHIEPVSAEPLLGGDSALNGQLWTSGLAYAVHGLGQMAGRELTADDVEPYNWTAAERGRTMSSVELAAALDQQQQWARSVIDWASGYDLLLTPTSGAVPMLTEDLWPSADKPWRIGRTYGRIGAFTLPFNATGQPAISLPLHWTDEGLPVGVQLVAAIGGEQILLTLAAELEQAAPWYHRYPA